MVLSLWVDIFYNGINCFLDEDIVKTETKQEIQNFKEKQ